jgi:hypothetical protein
VNGLFPIFLLSGIGHGMVELIRRIIPQSICGGENIKLRKMDSLVHAFYEVAGTSGAFFSAFLILNMGSIYANFYVPPTWILAGIAWSLIKLPDPKAKVKNTEQNKKKELGFLKSVGFLFKGFFISIYRGAVIIFHDRKFLWLIGGYSIPLILHRYLESQLAPAFSKHVLKQTAYSQIMVGGSNFGELTGAVFVVYN